MSVGVLLLVAAIGDLQSDTINLLEPHQQEVQLAGERRVINYRLFVPDVKPGRNYPLIVWLHGYGEHGTDNANQLKYLDALIFKPPREKDQYPFFLLAVQCPPDMGAWLGSRRQGRDMLEVTKELIDELAATRPIDVDRVCVAGVSAGGYACWSFMLRYPTIFAAGAPLASHGRSGSDIAKIAHIPIWTFHSRDDRRSSVKGARQTVALLTGAGGDVFLTEIDSSKHDCWTAAFNEYGLLDWLLAQKRGRRSWIRSPGVTPITFRIRRFIAGWTWWQALLQVVVGVAFGGVTIRLAIGLRRLFQHWRDTARPRKGPKKRLRQASARAGG